ncbi:MAG: PfkB family carbohydrate kinase [bacterium]|nr:sugar kinase [Gemmatimonadota bacterium]HIL89387.1 sugar kinase [Gemmatimonadota bacterium]
MSILAVGSVALDSVDTPFGHAERVIGGSAVFFSASASLLSDVSVVGVVGDDYPLDQLAFLKNRGVDLSGIQRERGESFSWVGKYHSDLSNRDTIETRLGVFEGFNPRIPEELQQSEYVFLGNIDPTLQHQVLDQVNSPTLVACDTMNYWIEGKRESLIDLLARVDILMLNDEEARQLSEKTNLLQASRWIQERGPQVVVVKKGEHGAALFADDWVFFVPGFPLEQVFDPTGAGDAFAGGLLGYISQKNSTSVANLRRAMVYGSVLGSFAVEKFSIDGLRDLTESDIFERVRKLSAMTTFEIDEGTEPFA